MKKYFLLCIGLAIAVGITAAPRSMQEAQLVAVHYFATHSSAMRAPLHSHALQHVWTAPQPNGEPALYVFNRGEAEGFIIVSADDNTRSILAYSDTGYFSLTELPDNARAWLEEYVRAIHHAAQTSDAAYHAMEHTTKTYTPVEPLCHTLWDQWDPYNRLCPLINGTRTLTGCTATAAAQIMKKHQYPTQGTGSHSYKWYRTQTDYEQLSADFGSTTYQWELMFDTLQYNTSEESRDAVATLMYHCGVAGEMNYGLYETGGSGTTSNIMLLGMVDHFGYDKGIRTICKDYMSEEAFLDSIHADLTNGLPVFFSAKTIQNGGHAFICDGMDANGLVHINWGWGGRSDAYFQVSALAPKTQGAGGSTTNHAYVVDVTAFTHIQPNQNGQALYDFTCANITLDAERVKRDERPIIRMDTITNRSIHTWTGNLVWVMYKNDKYYKVVYRVNSKIRGGYYYSNVEATPSFANIPAGDYTIVPAMVLDGRSSDFIPIQVRGKDAYHIPVRITADSVYLGETALRLQAIDAVYESSTPQCIKSIRDGQLLIERNGVVYDALGRKIR